jgi:hypothetical protein
MTLRALPVSFVLALSLLAPISLAACGDDDDAPPPVPPDLGADLNPPPPCDGPRPVCRAMTTCGCDEVVESVLGATCSAGCCPWICPPYSIAETACATFCGGDGGAPDASIPDASSPDAASADAGPPADWAVCTDQGQCSVNPVGCCAVCGAPTLADVEGVRMGREDQHYAEVCPVPEPCPRCPSFDVPELVPTCAAGQCKVVDLRMEAITACTTDAECRIRTTSCCECGGDPRYVAVSTTTESDAYAALVCPTGTACPECVPVYPDTVVARCVAGHCEATVP